jgi:hypothetical protein
MYWIGVVLVYLGLLALAAETVYEPLFARLARHLRILCTGIPFCLIGALTIWVTSQKFALDLVSRAASGNYPDGSTVEGITWKSGMSELRVFIGNQTPEDDEDVDVLIQPDQWTRAVTQVGAGPPISIIRGDPTFATPNLKNPDGTDVPIERTADTYGFRVLCSRLPSKSRIELLAATSVSRYPSDVDGITVHVPGLPDDEGMWPPKRLVQLVRFKAKYRTKWRWFRITQSQKLP